MPATDYSFTDIVAELPPYELRDCWGWELRTVIQIIRFNSDLVYQLRAAADCLAKICPTHRNRDER